MVDFNRPIHSLFGVPVDALSLEQAAGRLERTRRAGLRCFLSTPNLNILLNARRDGALRDSIIRSDLSVADGMPLVWLSRLVGAPVRQRVSGSGLFDWLRSQSASGWQVFFFGGPLGSGERACDALATSAGGMRGCGHLYPGFGDVEKMSRRDWIGQINDSGADFVVVSLGAQKGQAWITRNLESLRPVVVSHLGAVVNFVAGTVQRAPQWMQGLGLEWAWRMKEEPRLGRRYAGDAAGLGWLLASQALPLACLQLVAKPGAAAFARVAVTQQYAAGTGVLRLAGAWAEPGLRLVRTSFTQAVAADCDLVLDLAAVEWIDSAFAGLLLLLEADQRARGRKLVLQGAGPLVRWLLRLHGVTGLVEPA